MKNFFEKVIGIIKYWYMWTFSKEVLDAINNGAEYDEVERIARG